jgi:hypothetical protein
MTRNEAQLIWDRYKDSSDFSDEIAEQMAQAMKILNQPVEKIVSSAILHKGVIYTGKRHHNCIATIKAETGDRTPDSDPQGFLTDQNRFVDRVEGAKLALANGQITKLRFIYLAL